MDNENGSIAGCKDVPGDTAQEQSPDASLTSGADNNKIGTRLSGDG